VAPECTHGCARLETVAMDMDQWKRKVAVQRMTLGMQERCISWKCPNRDNQEAAHQTMCHNKGNRTDTQVVRTDAGRTKNWQKKWTKADLGNNT